jgi:hypothetical protein
MVNNFYTRKLNNIISPDFEPKRLREALATREKLLDILLLRSLPGGLVAIMDHGGDTIY